MAFARAAGSRVLRRCWALLLQRVYELRDATGARPELLPTGEAYMTPSFIRNQSEKWGRVFAVSDSLQHDVDTPPPSAWPRIYQNNVCRRRKSTTCAGAPAICKAARSCAYNVETWNPGKGIEKKEKSMSGGGTKRSPKKRTSFHEDKRNSARR